MFTTIDGVFKFSKDGRFAEEILESIGDNTKGVTIHTYSGLDYHLICDDFLVTAVKEVSYDTGEEVVFKNGIVEGYELDTNRNLNNCHIIKLNGVCFRVINFKGLILLNNEINNEVEYECKENELKELLDSVDKNYEVYRKEYTDL